MNGDEAPPGDLLADVAPPPPAPPDNPFIDTSGAPADVTSPSDRRDVAAPAASPLAPVSLLALSNDHSGGSRQPSEAAASPDDPMAAATPQPSDSAARDLARRLSDEDLLRAAAAARLAQTANPERVARALDLSRRTGLPVDLVERNLEYVQARIDAGDDRRTILRTKPLRDFINTDPANAGLVRDDVTAIGKVNEAWLSITRIAGERPYEAIQATMAFPGLALLTLPGAVPVMWRDTRDAFLRSLLGRDSAEQLMSATRLADHLSLIGEIKKKRAERAFLSPKEREVLDHAAEEEARLGGKLTTATQALVANLSEVQGLSMPPALREMREADTYLGATKAFLKDPLRITYTGLVESATTLIPAVVAGAVGGPLAAAGAVGWLSFVDTYAASVLENMQRRGVDLNDAKAMKVAFQDYDLMDDVYWRATTTAATVGLLNIVSMGLLPFKLVPKIFGLTPAVRQALNVPVQAIVQTGLAVAAQELGPRLAGNEPHAGNVVGAAVNTLPMMAIAGVTGKAGGSPKGGGSGEVPNPTSAQPPAAEAPSAQASRNMAAGARREESAPMPPPQDAASPPVMLHAPAAEAPPAEAGMAPQSPRPRENPGDTPPTQVPASEAPPADTSAPPAAVRSERDSATTTATRQSESPSPASPERDVASPPAPAVEAPRAEAAAAAQSPRPHGSGVDSVPTSVGTSAREPMLVPRPAPTVAEGSQAPSSASRSEAQVRGEVPAALRGRDGETPAADTALPASRGASDRSSLSGAADRPLAKGPTDIEEQLFAVARSGAQLATLNQIADQIGALKISQHAPERANQLVRRIVEQGGPRVIHVPAEALRTALHRLAPEQEHRVAGVLNDTLLSASGNVVVPTESYLTQLHPLARGALAEHIRLSPDGPSLRQVREAVATFGRAIDAADGPRAGVSEADAPPVPAAVPTTRGIASTDAASSTTVRAPARPSPRDIDEGDPANPGADAAGDATARPGSDSAPGEPQNVAASAERASFGTSTSSNYRRTFLNANPDINEADIVVHHAVEQKVLERYPGVVSVSEMHSIENLRGIPRAINNEIHLRFIRRQWNLFYEEFPNATKSQFLDKATEIDNRYGHHFNPRRGSR